MSADGQAVAFANAAEALAAPAEDISSLLHIWENWVFTKFQLTEVWETCSKKIHPSEQSQATQKEVAWWEGEEVGFTSVFDFLVFGIWHVI